MKIYCFQYDGDSSDYPTENGIAIAHNEEEAWKLFFKKYKGYAWNIKTLKENYKIDAILDTDKPNSWCGECCN